MKYSCLFIAFIVFGCSSEDENCTVYDLNTNYKVYSRCVETGSIGTLTHEVHTEWHPEASVDIAYNVQRGSATVCEYRYTAVDNGVHQHGPLTR